MCSLHRKARAPHHTRTLPLITLATYYDTHAHVCFVALHVPKSVELALEDPSQRIWPGHHQASTQFHSLGCSSANLVVLKTWNATKRASALVVQPSSIHLELAPQSTCPTPHLHTSMPACTHRVVKTASDVCSFLRAVGGVLEGQPEVRGKVLAGIWVKFQTLLALVRLLLG